MSRAASRAATATLICATLASACVTPPAPVLVPVQGEEARIAAWIAAARRGGSDRTALRALASLRLDSPSGSGRVREVVVVERPARLRLETLNLLGQTQALLVTNGERFSWFDGQAFDGGAVYSGLLLERLGLDLEPEEAVRVLLAAPHLSGEPPQAIFALGPDRIARFPGQRVRFAAGGDLRSVESLDEHGELRWIAEYGGWRDVDGGRYPFDMQLRFPRSRVAARFEVDEVELNPSLSPALFAPPRAAEDSGN